VVAQGRIPIHVPGIRKPALLVACLAIGAISGPRTSAESVVRAGTASISNDVDARTWTISAHGTSLKLLIDPARDFQVVGLVSPSGESRFVGSTPDTEITVAGRTVPFGSRSGGFVLQNVTPSVAGSTVRLDVTFDLPQSRLRATRHYAATSGSPTFETWTTFAPLGSSVALADLNGFKFTIPNGTVHWLNGLQGDDASTSSDAAFTRQERLLGVGQRLVLGASGRSSEQTVPWIAVDSGADVFYAGLLWSGAWSLTAERRITGLDLDLGLAPMTTSLAATIDGPHAFFGVTRGDVTDASAALRTFILRGLRAGRPFDALVTYNPWFAYGVAIDEASMRAEIDGASGLGAELFVLDAGWYTGAGRSGAGDFTSGLGSWQVDRAKFPSGLRALRDYAHDRGVKFGVWVEPERVAQSTIGLPGLAQESWLAKVDGKYGSVEAAQICLGGGAQRQWLLARLTALIDSVQPDYLKWDNNHWINCDRSGHVHAGNDGNFAHVTGLYQVLSELRQRYPDLLIENVSGGGNRMDLGMLRYTDVGWMDDRTTPSAKVRHNVQGLSLLFPPGYLLAFAMNDHQERLSDAEDLPLVLRSRMSAILGLCFKTGAFSDDDADAVRREISTYKSLRGTLSTGAGSLLSAQAGAANGPAWDVFQATPTGDRPIVVWATQADPAVRETIVRPVGLRAKVTYEVRSVDAGLLGIASGAELMISGVAVVASPLTAAHVLVFTPVGQS
jgi:alpha-galactosidase